MQRLLAHEEELSDEGLRQYLLDFQSATRGLIKQQMSWFRKDTMYRWVDLTDAEIDPLDCILDEFNKEVHEGVYALAMHDTSQSCVALWDYCGMW